MTNVLAQTTDTAKQKVDSAGTNKPKILISYGTSGDNQDSDTSYHQRHRGKEYPHFSFGITIARLDLGFATLIDNGSFTLAPQNQFLRYRSWKTSNAGFDLFQMGARFSNSFKIYLAAGLDWTNIRLRDNVTILANQPSLSYHQDNIDYSKNRFSSTYIRLPLSFDLRTKEDWRGNRFHFVFGPEAGFLLTASVKQISKENGEQKNNDTYNYATFRYGAFTRIGYGAWGIFAKYYFNDMFENSPDQAGLKNFSFGIMLGF
jgi:hypothetical protein